jgi:hypothetical protein
LCHTTSFGIQNFVRQIKQIGVDGIVLPHVISITNFALFLQNCAKSSPAKPIGGSKLSETRKSLYFILQSCPSGPPFSLQTLPSFMLFYFMFFG